MSGQCCGNRWDTNQAELDCCERPTKRRCADTSQEPVVKGAVDVGEWFRRGRVLSGLREEGKFCDLVFVVAHGQQIQAHRCVVSAASHVFCTMLQSGMREDSTQRIHLEHVPAATFLQLIEFIYNGTVQFSSDNALQILELAEQFELTPLTELCCKYLGETLHEASAWPVLDAAENLTLSELRDRAMVYVLAHFEYVLDCEHHAEFHRGFISCSQTLVLEILLSDDLVCSSEEAVFEAAKMYWQNKACSASQAEPLVSCVRFDLLSAEFMRDHVQPSEIVGQCPEVLKAKTPQATAPKKPFGCKFQVERRVEVNNSVVTSIHPREDLDLLVAASQSNDLSVYSLSTWEKLGVLIGHENHVCCVTTVGRTCVSGSSDNTVRFWRLDTFEYVYVGRQHSKALWCITSWAERDLAVAGSVDGTISCWSVSQRRCTKMLLHGTSVLCVAFVAQRGRRQPCLLSGDVKGNIKIWCVVTWECHRTIQVDNCPLMSLSATPQCNHAVVGTASGTFEIWSNLVASPEGTQPEPTRIHRVEQAHSDAVCCLATSEGVTVTGSCDGTIAVWDLANSTPRLTLKEHTKDVECLCVVQDRLISGASDGCLLVYV